MSQYFQGTIDEAVCIVSLRERVHILKFGERIVMTITVSKSDIPYKRMKDLIAIIPHTFRNVCLFSAIKVPLVLAKYSHASSLWEWGGGGMLHSRIASLFKLIRVEKNY